MAPRMSHGTRSGGDLPACERRAQAAGPMSDVRKTGDRSRRRARAGLHRRRDYGTGAGSRAISVAGAASAGARSSVSAARCPLRAAAPGPSSRRHAPPRSGLSCCSQALSFAGTTKTIIGPAFQPNDQFPARPIGWLVCPVTQAVSRGKCPARARRAARRARGAPRRARGRAWRSPIRAPSLERPRHRPGARRHGRSRVGGCTRRRSRRSCRRSRAPASRSPRRSVEARRSGHCRSRPANGARLASGGCRWAAARPGRSTAGRRDAQSRSRRGASRPSSLNDQLANTEEALERERGAAAR